MRRIITPLLFFFFQSIVFAQQKSAGELKIKTTNSNPSATINDGEVQVKVNGGVPPYTYTWSKKEISLSASKATGLTEGISYTVKVTDKAGHSATKKVEMQAKSITEKFNSWLKPTVDNMTEVLFWDPFEAVGLYDPVVYTNEKEVPIPNWDAKTDKEFGLKKWLKKEGAHVKSGEQIAVVSKEGGSDIDVYSPNEGTLHYLVNEGNVVFDPQKKEDVIERGANHVAKLTFNSPIPLKNPNGTNRKNTIPFIVVWLIAGSIFFTIKLGFVNLRGFRHAVDLAKGKYDDPDAPGKIRHFQAMTTAVSATVGLGNIAGVAVAISLGGAGATFWMFLAGFFAMSLKFVECTLGVKYREINKEGRIFGGPMNYLRDGLKKRNLGGLGKFLAILFAILCVGASFGGGNMLQSNQAFEIVAAQLPFLQGNGFWFGIGFAVLVGIVIIGGIDSIANVTSKVVPFMALTYIVGCLVVIGFNIENIGAAFSAIFHGALTPQAMEGGFLGVLIVGLQRAAFSSEAGIGSAAIAHSASKTNNPVADGFTALVEPFIDTMIVCTMTALVLIFTGMHGVDGLGGVALTSDAFASVISWFPNVLALAVFMFAFSTMVSWSYYGMRSWTYVFGKSKKSELVYKCIFLVFIVIGASGSLGAVLDFSDMMILAMAFPNIIGLYIMSSEVRLDMKDYYKRLKKGELFVADE